MKKLALLTVALLSSFVGLDAATKDDHICQQVKEGSYGSTATKTILDSVLVLAAMTKLSIPEKMFTVLLPFIHDLSETEVTALRNQAATLNLSQQQALSIVSKLNNGWYVIGTMFTMAGGSYLYYGSEAMQLDENIKNVARIMIGTYAVSQLTAAMIARYAQESGFFSKAKKAAKKITAEYVA